MLHEGYNTKTKPTFKNDIAVIVIDPLNFNDPKVQPIEMFTNSDEEITPGSYCISIGCSNSRPSRTKHASHIVDSEVISEESCKNEYSKIDAIITSTNICARKPCADINGSFPCRGDSGAPLVCPDSRGKIRLAGLVSFGFQSCRLSSTIVFTKISSFKDWILHRLNMIFIKNIE